MSVGVQCAVGPDGQLLPASEIIFYNDPDDDHPLPPVKTSSTKATNITEFFQRRSSSRISRPSARVSDPNNAESALKRKAPWDLDQPRSFARAHTSHAARSSSPSELDDDGDEIPSLRDASDSEDDGDEEESVQECGSQFQKVLPSRECHDTADAH
ncbi:hypothetical protein MVEN_00072000 [Mycena venus]|uniref:Uncharacterized protein n=1 Tax=Mycena venus TaxID=2733690 RepID=A0A8H7DI20_9AGAR|nr:hypothetical protein MVEN_00072000 [Mycena venus]